MLCRLALALTCTLALFSTMAAARAADNALMAGVATVDITPEPGKMLWGYSNREHGATGTLDPLMAKAVVLKSGDSSVAIVSLDLGRTPEETVLAKIRAKTKAECGVSNLFITASHTHHAPAMEASAENPNPYGEKVGDQIAEIICQAAKELVPIRIGVGRGTADFSHNRRKFLPDGRVAMQWRNAEKEPTDPVDREVATIRLDRADGSPLAILFSYACHPVVMGHDNYQYSADFVGPACEVVEKELKTKCLFLQGGCGNINPYMDKTPIDQGAVEVMRGMGKGLGEILVKTARATKTSLPAHPSIKYESHSVPIRVRWDIENPEVTKVLAQAYGPRFNNYLSKVIKSNVLQCPLTTLVIDGDLALVGMPGEIFVQFQTAIKTQSPIKNSFLVGYCNGFYGYFPTIRDAAAGGYGGKTATYVEPGAGERLTDEGLIAIYKLTDQLHDVPRIEDFKLLEYDDVKGKSAGK